MIVKNVGTVIERCLTSIVPYVDEVVIVDTGSSDDTKDAVRRAVSRVPLLLFDYTPETHPESFLLDVEETWQGRIPGPFNGLPMLADFGDARQYGWSRASGDFLLWIDSDDIVQGGEHIAGIIATMVSDGLDTALLEYEYLTDEHGNVTCTHKRERISRRTFAATWSQRVHEVLVPTGLGRIFDEVKIVHKRHEYTNPVPLHHRNLKILVHWHDQNKNDPHLDPRMLFYLAMEERFIWPEKGADDFREYCKRSGWDEERAMAHLMAGTVFENMARYDDAFSEYAQAAVDFPANPDGLFGCARVAYFKKDWDKVIEYTERARATEIEVHIRKPVLMSDPQARRSRPQVFLSAALAERHQWQRALDVCNEALIHAPNDPFLKGNKETAEKQLAQERSGQGTAGGVSLQFRLNEPLSAPPNDIPTDVLVTFIIQLWKRNIHAGDFARAKLFLDAVPTAFRDDPRVRKAVEFTTATAAPALPAEDVRTTPITAAKRPLSIVFWLGADWEPWTPESLNKGGIGGSETAAVHMAKQFALRGHDVTVLAGCEGTFDGVRYMHWEREDVRKRNFANADVLIASRNPSPALFYDAKVKLLWVHDVHVGTGPEVNDGLMRMDRIFALSKWHQQNLCSMYGFLDTRKIIVTRNGIDTARFARTPEKQGKRCIYASSADRGLIYLLGLFPLIRKAVPTAELHLYYGMKLWKDLAMQGRGNLAQVQECETLIAEGVAAGWLVNHGRVGQQELADAYLAASVWTYPTNFTETFCIGALEAQAAECVPVTTALAALNETVENGIVLNAPYGSDEYGRAFVDSVVRLLTNEEERARIGSAGRHRTLAVGDWRDVAVEWEELIFSLLDQKAVLGAPTAPKSVPVAPVVSVANAPLRVDFVMNPNSAYPRFGVQGFDIDRLLDAPRGLSGTDVNFFGSAFGLARKGCRVRVFAPITREMDANGVLFRQFARFSSVPDPADVSIAHYDMEALADSRAPLNIAVQHTYRLPHGEFYQTGKVHLSLCPSALTMRILQQNYGSLAPTMPWHHLPNANDVGRFIEHNPVPGRMIFHTSPERGLHRLLELLPAIRARVPHAHLFFVGDLDHLENYRNFDERHADIARRIKTGLAVCRDFVTILPRSSRHEVLRQLARAAVFAYPSDPPIACEVSPISIMDAMRTGVPVVLAPADGIEQLYAPSQAADIVTTDTAFVEKTVQVLMDPSYAYILAMRGKAFAKRYTFADQSDQLLQLIERVRTPQTATKAVRLTLAPYTGI